MGIRAVEAACRNMSWSFCDADSKMARIDNSSSVMRSPLNACFRIPVIGPVNN